MTNGNEQKQNCIHEHNAKKKVPAQFTYSIEETPLMCAGVQTPWYSFQFEPELECPHRKCLQ